MENHQHIFNTSELNFVDEALNAFHYQYLNNPVYHNFCNLLNINVEDVKNIDKIPFLPVSFFKSHETCFELFYGKPENYYILALLPSYLERDGSSLIYMTEKLIEKSKHASSGFYLHNIDELAEQLIALEESHQKTLLIGVSFALLDLFEKHQFQLKHTTIMETGGMKGKRKELTREELHQFIKKASGVKQVHSEYGMTELLSQAYAKNDGLYSSPPWMKIIIKDINDPFQSLANNKTGAINIIDLANIDSCCFIATQDLGKINKHGQFEVLGRFDNSDIRGCNLLVQ